MNAYFICLHVKHVQNSILKTPQISLGSGGIIINLMTEGLGDENILCRNSCVNILIKINAFLEDDRIMLIDKTDSKILKIEKIIR